MDVLAQGLFEEELLWGNIRTKITPKLIEKVIAFDPSALLSAGCVAVAVADTVSQDHHAPAKLAVPNGQGASETALTNTAASVDDATTFSVALAVTRPKVVEYAMHNLGSLNNECFLSEGSLCGSFDPEQQQLQPCTQEQADVVGDGSSENCGGIGQSSAEAAVNRLWDWAVCCVNIIHTCIQPE